MHHAPLRRVFAIVITALGGTMMTGFLLGQPPSWVCFSEVVPAYVVCWIAMDYCPGGAWYRLLSSSPSADRLRSSHRAGSSS